MSDEYVIVKKGDKIKIPDKCPKCGKRLNHVNAMDTVSRLYLVSCSDNRYTVKDRCRWADVYKFE